MTPEEKEALVLIQGSQGWRVMEYLIQKKIATLNSVEDLDGRSVDKVGIEALARQKAVRLLRDFLGDMGISVSRKSTNQTYE